MRIQVGAQNDPFESARGALAALLVLPGPSRCPSSGVSIGRSVTDVRGHERYGAKRLHLVAEELSGGPPPPGAVVHHINGNRRNNHPESLRLCRDGAEHMRIHVQERQRNPDQLKTRPDIDEEPTLMDLVVT